MILPADPCNRHQPMAPRTPPCRTHGPFRNPARTAGTARPNTSDGAGTRTAICAHFGDPGRCDLDPGRNIAALEQLTEHRLALGFNSRPKRLLDHLRSQRVGDLNVHMLLGGAILNLPAIDLAGRAKNRNRSRPTDDLKIASHPGSMTAPLGASQGPLASIFTPALDMCSAQLGPDPLA